MTIPLGDVLASQYVCDDGSIADSGECADGSTASFLCTDSQGLQCPPAPSGQCPSLCPNGFTPTSAVAVTTSPASSSTLIIVGIIAVIWYFGSRG
jgi:hypothetical protein